MELSLRSFVVYTAACGFLLVAFVVWAILSNRLDVRIRSLVRPLQDGHFDWAQAELEQIAEQRDPQRQKDEAWLRAALFRAELEREARRIIGELSQEGRDDPTVNVEETLARGWGATSSYGLMRQLMSTLHRPEALEHHAQNGSGLVQLRRLMDGEAGANGYRKGRAVLGLRDG